MKLTAQEVYNKLVNEDKILELQGQIKFFLGDVNIIVKQKDVVGNIIQEWLQGWLDKRGIEYAPSENTQMPPDFFLNPDDKTKNLLEVKAFNRSASPGFDIADFRMYQSEIIEKPFMLDVDYLIFGYEMSDEGVVTIKDIWLKKVWEITRRMEDWPINLQIKEGHVHKIRPGIWYNEDTARTDFSNFSSLEDFISAIAETVYQNAETHNDAPTWLIRFNKSYKASYGKTLNIPRWTEIANNYDIKSVRRKEKIEEQVKKAEEALAKQVERCRNAQERYDLATANGNQEKIEKAKEVLDKALERRSICEAKLAERRVALNAL